MTADALQSIVRVLSNSTWCRYWLNWGDRRENVKMAIQCRDANGNPQIVRDAIGRGFAEGAHCVYTIDRTNKDGTPYVPKSV